MRRIHCATLAAVAVIGFASVASAADLPVKAPMYTKAPVMAPLYNWTGFYIGLNAGYSWGRQDNDLVDAATGVTILSNSDNLNGFIGGGQIGYNWQVNQWVFGLEADFQGSGQKGDGTFFLPGGVIGELAIPSTSIAYTDKLDWFGTVRGRIGYAMGATGNWLPYVTGGWAYGHGEISGTTTRGAVVTSFSGSQDYSGWTVGGGLEWAFMDHWSAKAEYLYIDFGNGPTVAANAAGTLNIVSGRMTDNIARLGVNYKF
jgi:outer membrane immunogenic protein